MSRYPFDEFAAKYLASIEGVYSTDGFKSLRRRYSRISRDLRAHLAAGRISTTSPRTMTADDVRYHLAWRRSLGFSQAEFRHEVSALRLLFDFCENSAVRTCLRKYPTLRPAGEHTMLPSFTMDEYGRIIRRMAEVAESDDRRLVRSYAMLALFLGCGLRTKELRFIEVRDLDTSKWVLTVLHVKGESTYGRPRMVPIAPEFVGIICRYLELYDPQPDSSAFFPPTAYSSSPYMCGNSIRRILGHSLKDLGLDADPRKLRRSYGQHLLDTGIDSIETVSVLMGHSTTKTTERFYARRRNDIAIEAVRRTWAPVAVHTDSETPAVSPETEPDMPERAEKNETVPEAVVTAVPGQLLLFSVNPEGYAPDSTASIITVTQSVTGGDNLGSVAA